VVSGSTYSSSRESRMLMIGGQIFHEGDTVAKGVVLRTIKPHAAVFAYRDYLYELAF
jgi:general secretion pathway protein B